MSETVSYAIGSGVLRLIAGDITTDDGDAIVNAANSALAGGGGVDGAIHRAAGPKLLAACRDIIARIGRLPAGGAVITPGFDLPARHVIHTVGPIWRGGNDGEAEALRSAYAQSLARAAEANLTTVSFPAISTGAYGYPLDQAARIALETLGQGLESGPVREIRVYLHGKNAFDLWRSVAEALFS
ncbi:Appr-1-p processing domain protein [Solidesulfovibrio carbinoliphilus subsp. oakridgensis]|uniref:Appr-1-p processing domain protein n=1 Tax=Solidesulfovibrio carbinoliphilus subsp. oakridgensis TaxID=694327 RepID=G7Q5I2_9BACT|nr:O-acetyl-ADP-ribose deacetylase [Solidesulfovibrio carbinoliphilus]EHJ48983.1 Appr-1-p processing domain protein [Solidesulfovibrio carbinoliphilus subsp. oakridgensis]